CESADSVGLQPFIPACFFEIAAEGRVKLAHLNLLTTSLRVRMHHYDAAVAAPVPRARRSAAAVSPPAQSSQSDDSHLRRSPCLRESTRKRGPGCASGGLRGTADCFHAPGGGHFLP